MHESDTTLMTQVSNVLTAGHLTPSDGQPLREDTEALLAVPGP